jgi:flagellar hook assembly protein FlgD
MDMRIVTAVMALALVASVADGQNTSYRDTDYDFDSWHRFGLPEKLTLDETGDVGWSGGELILSYSMDRAARMWMAVYSVGANAPACDACGPGGALERAVAGGDTLVWVSDGIDKPTGAGSFIWPGTDYNGDVVPEGTFRYFLFAMNTDLPITAVGGTNNPYSMGIKVDPTDNPEDPWVYWIWHWDDAHVSGNHVLKRELMSTNLLPAKDHGDPDRPKPWESYSTTWMHELTGRPDDTYSWTDMGDFQIDPDDNMTFYFNHHRHAEHPTGVFKATLDVEAGVFTPDPDWPEDNPGSYVDIPSRISGSALMSEWHKEAFADDGLIWFTHYPREQGAAGLPVQPAVYSLDRATGAIVDLIDYTIDYTTPWVDAEGGEKLSVTGPFGIDIDAEGIYTTSYTGHWFNELNSGDMAEGEEPAVESFPMKKDFDGNVIWVNRNGDGFIDRYVGAEAEAAGVTWEDNVWGIDVAVTSWGITVWGQFNTPIDGIVFGPDGNGLFHMDFRGAGVPGGIPGFIRLVNEGTAYDGLYVGVGGELGVKQNPMDLISGLISDQMTAVAETGSGVTPESSSLGDAHPNPFNPDVTIPFDIADVGEVHVRIALYNVAGQEVAVLVDQPLHSSTYEATWDGLDASGHPVASGVYIYQMKAGDFVDSKQMNLLK